MTYASTIRASARLTLPVVFALVVGACTDDTTDATTTTPGTIAPSVTTTSTTMVPSTVTTVSRLELRPYGGEVVLGTNLEPATLNTFAPGGHSSIVTLIGNAYWTGVQDIDGFTLELIPDVVTELPTVANGGITINPDGTETIRYTIHDEAVWADGTPISGFDFEFTYETIMDPELPIVRTIYEDFIPESIEADEKTIEFTLSKPTLRAEVIFGTILPKHDVAGSDFINDYNDTMWVSGGPFEFEQWQEGEFVSLTRNPNYWKTDAETGQNLPYLDRVIFRFLPDTPSLIDAFRAREVDVINPPPTIEAIEDLQSLESEGASVEVRSGPVWEHLGFQFGSNRFVTNPNSYNEFLEYRKAVAHAIDKNKIVDEILKGQVEPMSSYVDAYSPALSQGAWDQYDYNPEKARQYITDLCARDDTDCDARPVTTVFTTSENNKRRVAMSLLLGEMLEAAGIAYEVRLEPAITFFGETIDFGLYDIGEWAWKNSDEFASLSSLVAVHDFWDPEAPPEPGPKILNIYRWGTPAVVGIDPEGFNQPESSVIDESTARFGELRDRMNETVDERELIGYINEAEDILANNVVIIPLYQQLDPGAVWADEIGGYIHAPSIGGDTWNIERWYRADLMR